MLSYSREPYYYSKKCAEETLWDFVEKNEPHFTVAVANPSFVIGPVLHDRQGSSESVSIHAGFMNGTLPGTANFGFGYVDVRGYRFLH